MTYLELIKRGALYHTDRIALKFQDETLTYRQVDEISSQLAHAFSDLGIKAGDRVGLLLNNSLYSVPVDFACVKRGVNRVPLNSRLSVSEHQRMLEETGCSFLLYGADLVDHAAALKEKLPSLHCHGIGRDGAGGRNLLENLDQFSTLTPEREVTEDEIVLTLFTSGTTGTLKAAQHTQGSYAAICHNVLLNMIDVRPDDRMLHAASLIHASGVFILPFWLKGGTAVIMSAFEPLEYLELIERENITAINLVPTMLQMLLEFPEFATTKVETLRHVLYGASPMPRPVIKKAMDLWGSHRFWQYFGQTECPLGIAVLRPEDHEREELLGACGRPSLEMQIRLVDEDGKDVPAGDAGEIAIKSPTMMAGYYNAPELNAEMYLDGGWLRTRDIGQFDAEGYLHLKDRTSDMIITGGYNVYPREVEDIIVAHPVVLECAVVGLKDSKWVEAVTAAVVLREGMAVSEQALIDYVADKVAAYKKPQKVIFVKEIPKTAVGKLNRKILRESL